MPLAPSADLLRAAKAAEIDMDAYGVEYRAQLAAIDPAAVARDVGEGAVLLCFEPPGYCCHRRLAAEWLEAALEIEVPELGFARDMIPAFADSPTPGAPADELPWDVHCDHCRRKASVPLGLTELLCGRCGQRSLIEW